MVGLGDLLTVGLGVGEARGGDGVGVGLPAKSAFVSHCCHNSEICKSLWKCIDVTEHAQPNVVLPQCCVLVTSYHCTFATFKLGICTSLNCEQHYMTSVWVRGHTRWVKSLEVCQALIASSLQVDISCLMP